MRKDVRVTINIIYYIVLKIISFTKKKEMYFLLMNITFI